MDIWRLNPIQEKIDQVPLCTSKRLFWVRSWSMEEDIYKKIPPRVIKRYMGLLSKMEILDDHSNGYQKAFEDGKNSPDLYHNEDFRG